MNNIQGIQIDKNVKNSLVHTCNSASFDDANAS